MWETVETSGALALAVPMLLLVLGVRLRVWRLARFLVSVVRRG